MGLLTELCVRLERVEHAVEELRQDWRFDLDNVIGCLRLIGQALDINKGIEKFANNVAKRAAQRRKK